jgi:putative membrane protein
MKKFLSDHHRNQLNLHIAETEKQTNTQIVLAVIKRCDAYAEIPWKAFALGSSIAGLLFFMLNLLLNFWSSQTMVLTAITATLSTGIVFALLAVFVLPFAKIFLSKHRGKEEVRQYAESLFLTRELFATTNRTGILLLVSMFERQVILIPDKGISNQLTNDTVRNIIAPMTALLKRNEVNNAMEEGLKQLSLILEAKALGRTATTNENELPNQIIEEKGI